jgi:hypothetical protein
MSNLCTKKDRSKLFESKDLRQLGNLGGADLIGYASRMDDKGRRRRIEAAVRG